ncbi:hypothetical protein CDL12_08507 [Handroanthus impetiginosus]|uniref:DOG1 domain-containing protein n=1 Tax=Handroanthus impetiginosus TaxID=429701 RepID=A0A2G9HMS4_9LAMI|nr:hypothetical protein CDL12_08507 [Handroanthus impetiginosus]
MENNDQVSKQSCFLGWMNLQEEDLAGLLQALNLYNNSNEDHNHASDLKQLVYKNISHYQEYVSQRATLAQNDVCPYFSPRWCTSLEGSMFGNVGLGDLSSTQLKSINNLHLKTMRQEDKTSMKLESLQEEIADDPIAIIAKELQAHGEASAEVDKSLVSLLISLRSMLEETDNLSLNTLKKLISILTPIQAVDFLATARKLNLCVHERGRRRDQEHENSIMT